MRLTFPDIHEALTRAGYSPLMGRSCVMVTLPSGQQLALCPGTEYGVEVSAYSPAGAELAHVGFPSMLALLASLAG